MLCKLVKIHDHTIDSYLSDDYFGRTIKTFIADGISDWEELDEKSLYTIQQFVWDYNSTNKNKDRYLLVEKPEITLKFCINEQLKKEQEKIKRHKKEEEEYQKKEELEKLNRLKKKAEREKKKLEELKKKYGEQ